VVLGVGGLVDDELRDRVRVGGEGRPGRGGGLRGLGRLGGELWGAADLVGGWV
jgi:hypothetical protein